MNIELRNISRNERLSEENHCYSAKIYMNGVYIADVGNHGHGGPDEVRALKGKEKALEVAEAWCKALPPLPSEYFADGLPMDLELWCGTAVDDFMTLKDLRRALKRKVLLAEGGKVMEYSWKGVKEITPRHIDAIRAKHPNAPILNTLPEAEALALYRKAA